MTVKEKIINTLKETGVDHIDKMLQYMEDHGFYTCKGHSHNKWTGGTSQHVWAVYINDKALRDKNKEIAKKCGDSTILSGHRNIGSSDHRNLNGIYTDVFGGCASARNL